MGHDTLVEDRVQLIGISFLISLGLVRGFKCGTIRFGSKCFPILNYHADLTDRTLCCLYSTDWLLLYDRKQDEFYLLSESLLNDSSCL